MKLRYLALLSGWGLILAACSSGADASDGVASLSQTTVAADSAVESQETNLEEALLAFAQCMRDEGLDFPDPAVDADGNIEFQGRQPGSGDPEAFRAGFEACEHHLEGVALPFAQSDFTEFQDTLVEFASCMRDNGFDMPDPDFSNFGPGQGRGQGGGPFGAIDPNDPEFQAAMASCEDILAGFGPGRGRPGAGGGPGGGS